MKTHFHQATLKVGLEISNELDHCEKFPYQSRPSGYASWTEYTETKCSKSRAGVDNAPHVHHIVMKGDAFPENAEARQILCKHGINPYIGCENLVISPNKCHSQSYAVQVLRELQKVASSAEFVG